jgi:hypothetical protein
MNQKIISPFNLNIDFNDPAQNLKAFARVFVDIDPTKVAVGWFGGTVYSVIGDSSKIEPLIGIEGIGLTRTRPGDSGVYQVFNRELAFYKDLRTDDFIDNWTNPLNGESCEIFPIQNMTVNAEMSPIMKMDMEGTMVEYPFLPPWTFLGGYANSTFEIHASLPSELKPDKWPRESSGPMTRISEMFMRSCRIDDLANEDLTSVSYVGTWTRLSSWFPWMLMGQAEGHLYFRCYISKFNDLESLPATFLAKAEKEHAAYLEPPSFDSWGQRNDSTFNMWKKLRKPVPVNG